MGLKIFRKTSLRTHTHCMADYEGVRILWQIRILVVWWGCRYVNIRLLVRMVEIAQTRQTVLMRPFGGDCENEQYIPLPTWNWCWRSLCNFECKVFWHPLHSSVLWSSVMDSYKLDKPAVTISVSIAVIDYSRHSSLSFPRRRTLQNH